MEKGRRLISGFEHDVVQKKSKFSTWMDSYFYDGFYRFGCLVGQVRPPLLYSITYMEVSISVGRTHKMLWQAVACSPLI